MWLLLIASLALPEEGVKFFDGSFEKALERAKEGKKAVFIDFYTDW